MLKKHLLALGLIACVPAYADIYKCTKPDGGIAYSDVPCGGEVKIIEKPRRSQEQQQTINSSYIDTTPIDFGNSVPTMFYRASGILESIKIDGRDCEWALKVDESKIGVCRKFIGSLVDGGPFTQAGDAITRAIDADTAWANQNISEIARVTRTIQDIVRYKEFVLARLGMKR